MAESCFSKRRPLLYQVRFYTNKCIAVVVFRIAERLLIFNYVSVMSSRPRPGTILRWHNCFSRWVCSVTCQSMSSSLSLSAFNSLHAYKIHISMQAVMCGIIENNCFQWDDVYRHFLFIFFMFSTLSWSQSGPFLGLPHSHEEPSAAESSLLWVYVSFKD